jgi:tripartite-type tricarboxylate transporter receptor subunit TctC
MQKRAFTVLGYLLVFMFFPLLHAQEKPIDFSGKTIDFIIPILPGGGTDAWAKSVLPHFHHFMPGNPVINILNIPGGNATKAANEYAEMDRLDGTSVLVTGDSTQLSYIFDDSRVRYDFSQWKPILAYQAGMVVYTSASMDVKDIDELTKTKDRHLVLASMAPTSADLFVLLAFDMLGLEISPIFGTPGRGEARQIYLRGEANIDFQTTVAYVKYVKPDQDAGRAVPLFTLGSFDKNMSYVRDPMFPQLPNVAELYQQVHGELPSGEAWDAWLELYGAGGGSLKLLLLPRYTDESVIKVYKNAIDKMISDSNFQSDVADLLGPRAMVSGKDAEALLKSRTTVSDKTRQWIKNWIFERYQVRL